ncbi:MAG: glycosyltransferase [Acidimicrobiales bacterium]
MSTVTAREPRRSLLVVAMYPPSQAATRLRCMQYRDHLCAEDLGLTAWTLLTDADMARWYELGAARRIALLLRRGLRLFRLPLLVRRATVVLVQRRALPIGPPVVELLIARRRPLIWDVDDAIWTDYPALYLRRLAPRLRRSRRHYEKVCAAATEVWAGSEVLASWCRLFSRSVQVVPTVVAVPAELPDRALAPRLGWVGSPSTSEFLEPLIDRLLDVDQGVTIRVVGGRLAGHHGRLTALPWTPRAERVLLEETSIGLYPIDSAHALADGKCGLKAILYMASGITCVVSPTPTNAAIVRDRIDGLHAKTPDEWAEAIAELLGDRLLWETLRRSGYERVKSLYSLQRWGPFVATRVATLAGAN